MRRFDSSGKPADAHLPLHEFKAQLTSDGGLTLFDVGPNNKAVILGNTEDTVFEVSSTGQILKYVNITCGSRRKCTRGFGILTRLLSDCKKITVN